MKKFLALLLACLMLLSVAACGETAGSESSSISSSEPADATVGTTLYNAFKADSTGTAEEIANRIITNEIIQFMGGAVAIEEGFLSGFGETEIKGFKEGAMFAPMIGTIPFVGYIFKLEDGADVEAFKTTLKDNANLRWNICTAAEEMIVESKDNTVFFLMCPSTFEQETPEDSDVSVE
ncbi:MAG: hypothetical protein IKT60_03880 [Clostridia bacterium]|nr:hypothetical protein [Clostridia bacterium]